MRSRKKKKNLKCPTYPNLLKVLEKQLLKMQISRFINENIQDLDINGSTILKGNEIYKYLGYLV